jgi:hypothetical protein
MKKWSFVALLIVGATILGATVLREPIAQAGSTVSATIIGPLDGSGNVKVHEQGTAAVHEQGTANVNVTNSSVPTHEQGTANVNVTNSTLSVTPPAATKHDVQLFDCGVGETLASGPIAASFIDVQNTSGVDVSFDLADGNFGLDGTRFTGALAPGQGKLLELTQPVVVDRILFTGSPTGGNCVRVTVLGD